MNVAIIGTGYVGLVTGTCLAEFGCSVVGVDKDHEKIERLARGELPIFEPGLRELLEKNLRAGRLRFSLDFAEAVQSALVVFIAVGTPSRGDGSADLQYIEDVSRLIAKHLNGYKVIVTKSTVPVGTGRWITGIIEEELAAGPARASFDVAANPEFLREGAAVEDFMRPNRVVIGADSPQAAAILQDLYRPLYLIETPIVTTTVEAAELIKYASNAFLATKISFTNEIATLCEALAVDVHVVAKAMGLDQRIGGKFLHPGPGFGGSCLPKDLRALIQLGQSRGCRLPIVEAALGVNELQRARMVRKIVRTVTGSAEESLDLLVADRALDGRILGVLGLAFKPNTDDVRDAPALAIVPLLIRMGARVRAFDPAAMAAARPHLPDVELVADPYEAVTGADALVLLTEWNEFRNLDLERIAGLMRGDCFLDLRNVYEPARARRAGFRYDSVGRP